MGESNLWEQFDDSLADADEPVLEFDTNGLSSLEDASRYFIVVYNSTTTVSAVYAAFIALAIAAAIGAVLGLIYWTFLSSKDESSSYAAPSDGYGKYKRSARESWEEELNFVRILGLIERMQRRLAESEHSANEKCRNRLFRICQNFADADFNEMIIEAK